MTNTSATGGYLAPTSAELEDDPFLDFFHDVIQGITGIAGDLIRPRWQPSPPTIPPRNANWIAFGITSRVPDQAGYEAHDGTGDGQTTLVRYEDCEMMFSFYGPGAEGFLTRFREGLLIGQNRDVLAAAQVGIKRFGASVPVPQLIKEQWLYRSDLPITLRRQMRRVYPILNIIEGVGVVITDKPATTTPFDTGA